MKLLTKEIEKALKKTPLYSTDGQGDNAKVIVKFFNPCGVGTWLVTEGAQEEDGDWFFFGKVELGYDWEWGYFTLSQLQEIKLPFGMGIEREIYTPVKKRTVSDLMR